MLLASDYDKSKYFRGPDLDREKKFRIKETTEEELTDRKTGVKEKKLVVSFTNDNRGLVLNKGNLRALKGAFGEDTAGWKTKVIALYPVIASNGEPGLRVRILPPKQDATAASPAPATAPSGTATASPTSSVAPSGNGAATPVPAVAAPVAVVDPELVEPDPEDEWNDEVPR
jgi:hypothetical protein